MSGNPATVVAKVSDLLRFWQAQSLQYPWADLIAKPEGAFDPAMVPNCVVYVRNTSSGNRDITGVIYLLFGEPRYARFDPCL